MPPQTQMIRRELAAPFAGVDRYNHRTKMRPISAYTLKNMWTPTVGVCRKQWEPATVATITGMSSYRANGLTEYTDSSGTVYMVAAIGGQLWKSAGENSWAQITLSATLSTTNPVRFAQYDGTLYFVDGVIFGKWTGSGAASVILQASTKGPIEPGSVSIEGNGTAVLWDTNSDGQLLTGGLADKGDIDYDTLVGSIASDLVIAAPITANYTSGTAKSETFRASIDGKMIPNLLHGTPAYLTLTTGATMLHTHATNHDDTGIYNASEESVGTIDRTNGTIQVTTASALSNSTAVVTNAYAYGDTTVTGEEQTADMPFPGSGFTVTNAPVKPGSCSFIGAVSGYVMTDPSLDGVLKDGGTTPVATIDYATGVVTMTAEGGDPGTETWTCAYHYYASTATAETLPKSSADGKFDRFTLSNIPCISGRLTLSSTAKSVVSELVSTDTPPTFNLFDGATDVGDWNRTTGTFLITTASTFAASATITATYYQAVATTDEAITLQTAFTLGGTTSPPAPTDLLWAKNKMWLACGTLLHKSDSLAPETFSTAPYELKGGKGVKISRLLLHRKDRIIALKGDGYSSGSIHPVDIASSDTTEWQATAYFDNVSLCSFSAAVRADDKEGADIFIPTREGVRTLATSDQDIIKGPTTPIDLAIRPVYSPLETTLTNAQLSASWGIMFRGVYYRWINDKVYCLNLNMPRESLQDAWTWMEMAAYDSYVGIEADCGCVCDFGSGPNLYVGGPAGKIVKMFAAQTEYFTGTAELKALCAMVDEQPSLFIDIVPYRVGVRVEDGTSGLYYAYLVDSEGNAYTLGGNNVGTATAVIASDVSESGTFTVPLNATSIYIPFRVQKTNATFNWDEITLHAPEGANYNLDISNVSGESVTGATINLVGRAMEAGWTGTYQVRCTV